MSALMDHASVSDLENVSLSEASEELLDGDASTESQAHVKLFHDYVALRLILEGGFLPEEVTPRTPLPCTKETLTKHRLGYDETQSTGGEANVLGEYQSKQTDVVANDEEAGPVLGVSVKSTGKSFRNLTNRIEEMAGDAANAHGWYPGFVHGFLHIVKRVPLSEELEDSDDASHVDGEPKDRLYRYAEMLEYIGGRKHLRDPGDKYESTCLIVLEKVDGNITIDEEFTSKDSPIHFSNFFDRLYKVYDRRYCNRLSRNHHCRTRWDTYETSQGGSKNVIPIDLSGRIDSSGDPYTLRNA